MAEPRKLKRAVIREELVLLTDDLVSAVLLGQLMYWHERTKDTDKYIVEETQRMASVQIDAKLLPTYGWIYKSAKEMLDETMLGCSERTINRALDMLVERGWVQRRTNPNYKWDRTYQYRVDLLLIQQALSLIGYHLEGYVFDDVCIRRDDESSSQSDASSSRAVDAIPETTTETTTQTTSLKVADATPTSFDAWLDELRQAKNKGGVARRMFVALYPKHDPPDYGYIGKTARSVGGWSRFAQLLWEHSARPPVGDVLAYIAAAANRGNGSRASPMAAVDAAIDQYLREETHGNSGDG